MEDILKEQRKQLKGSIPFILLVELEMAYNTYLMMKELPADLDFYQTKKNIQILLAKLATNHNISLNLSFNG